MAEKWYDQEEDILNIEINKGDYWKSIELPNGIVIDVTKEGTIMGMEIMHASKVFSGDVQSVLTMAKQVKA